MPLYRARARRLSDTDAVVQAVTCERKWQGSFAAPSRRVKMITISRCFRHFRPRRRGPVICVKAITMSEDFPATTAKSPRPIGRIALAAALVAAGLVGFLGWGRRQNSSAPRLQEELKQAAVRG